MAIKPVYSVLFMIPICSLKQVQSLSPDFEKLKEIEKRLSALGCCVFTRETVDPKAAIHMRFFAPAAGVFEDPATGSAAGALGAYLVSHDILRSQSPSSFIIEQGLEIQRSSRIVVTVHHEVGVPTLVKVGGEAVTVLEGELTL